jgi:hypothetical protein
MITPGLLGSLMGSMGGGAGAPLDLGAMLKLPTCAVCAKGDAVTLVLGTLVCALDAERVLDRFDIPRPSLEDLQRRADARAAIAKALGQ